MNSNAACSRDRESEWRQDHPEDLRWKNHWIIEEWIIHWRMNDRRWAHKAKWWGKTVDRRTRRHLENIRQSSTRLTVIDISWCFCLNVSMSKSDTWRCWLARQFSNSTIEVKSKQSHACQQRTKTFCYRRLTFFCILIFDYNVFQLMSIIVDKQWQWVRPVFVNEWMNEWCFY